MRYKWKTSKGEKLFMYEMTDSHLLNAWNFFLPKKGQSSDIDNRLKYLNKEFNRRKIKVS